MMWSGLWFFVGALTALLITWIGFPAVLLIVFYVVVIAVEAEARARSAAGPLAFGLMLAVIAVYQGASCPAVTPIEGGLQTCEGGPDVRVYLVVAAITTVVGLAGTYRQWARSR